MTISVGTPVITPRVHYNLKDSDPLVPQRIVKVPVTNLGIEAQDCTACVTAYNGADPNDDAPLKWAGLDAFTRPILPSQTVYLDIAGILEGNIVLHTCSDIRPIQERSATPGNPHSVKVRLCASGGQYLDFVVSITLPEIPAPTANLESA